MLAKHLQALLCDNIDRESKLYQLQINLRTLLMLPITYLFLFTWSKQIHLEYPRGRAFFEFSFDFKVSFDIDFTSHENQV